MKAMCHLQCDDGDITADLHGQLVLTAQEKDAINSILSGKPKFTPADISLLSCIYHKTTIPDMLLRLLLMKHIFKADIRDDVNNLSRHLHEPSLLVAMLHSLRNSSFSVEIPSVIVHHTRHMGDTNFGFASGAEVCVTVCVVNEGASGKSALVGRFVTGKFLDTVITVGVDVCQKRVDVHGINCVLQIWDTAGQERYRERNILYARLCSVLIFVYDTTSIEEFRDFRKVVEVYHTHCPGAQVILCGTKMDLESQRQVPQQAASDMATDICASAWIETSAYTGENVDRLFYLAALCGLQVLKDKREKGAPKYSKTS
ncbi:GTP-binding protein [Pelomyxa schiedti]|nr:GTP-binding protein [Pelomyxa schiedti]